MANLYYNAAVDAAWDTLGNWWNDASFTTPATALPADGDTVYLSGFMTSGPSTPVTLAHIHVADPSTGGGSFGVNFTGATGDATFNDSSFNNSLIDGNATFNDTSYNNGGYIAGNAIFNDYSFLGGLGVVSGNVTFNDYSILTSGIISGNATFNDASYNNGFVVLDATFNDTSYNQGVVSGDVTFDLTAAATQIKGGYNGSFSGDVFVSGGSGGGSDNTISRLLDLPWFINL
jgi:hypothetical protein